MNFVRRKETKAIVVHNSGADARDMKHQFDKDRKYHKSLGWLDIGYHIYIERDGSVKYGRPLWARGAHSKRANSFAIGVAFAGDFIKHDISAAQVRSGRKVISSLLTAYNLTFADVKGHKFYDNTDCPGHLNIDVLRPVSSPSVELPDELPDGVDGDLIVKSGVLIASGFLLLSLAKKH